MAVLAVIYLVFAEGGRIGVGGNEAVFAFVAGVAAISAAIPIGKTHRYLPNGPHWLILGLVSVLASETRAVIVVLPVLPRSKSYYSSNALVFDNRELLMQPWWPLSRLLSL